MTYRIKENRYLWFDEVGKLEVLQSCIITYQVQMRRFGLWITIKEFDEGKDTEFAYRQAEELIELLQQ